jgi:hypothetical protein
MSMPSLHGLLAITSIPDLSHDLAISGPVAAGSANLDHQTVQPSFTETRTMFSVKGTCSSSNNWVSDAPRRPDHKFNDWTDRG